MSIDIYPKFRELKLSDAAVFDRAFKDRPPAISEFTFTNLYSWRRAYSLRVSLFDGLIILCSESESRKRFFNPVGKGDMKTSVEKILKDSGGIFFRLPEEARALFAEDKRFRIEPDRDNWDYLYSASDLINLPGRKYDGKRNLIKKFKSERAYEYIILDAGNVALCLDFEEAWCSVKNCDKVEGLSQEKRAIKDMVENFSSFGLIGAAIQINGVIRALVIAQELSPDTVVMHILKADPAISGLYQTILQEFISRVGVSFRYVNMEQDLGIEGLRKAKLSYHPCSMINKYTLSLLEQ
ncbi:MAG: phosphatidylglycerol lysyltransferase domain-containing protein [Candidatus Omnitrophota bacterium]|nr:phosphatidylglycerol lysyltransferase domain-containing protein [Candidatus Omnitrophota bacterium]